MVAALSKRIKQEFGYLGLFLIISAWGILALIATLLYPKNPSPKPRMKNIQFTSANGRSTGNNKWEQETEKL
jgi:hypothetical protein